MYSQLGLALTYDQAHRKVKAEARPLGPMYVRKCPRASRPLRTYLHSQVNLYSAVRRDWARGDRWIRWTTTGCVALLALIAGYGLLPAYAHACCVALAARLGRGTHSALGGRDDRRCINHPARRIAVGQPRRCTTVGTPRRWQRSELGGQCRRRRAHLDRPGDRGVAQLRVNGFDELLTRRLRRSAAGDAAPAEQSGEPKPCHRIGVNRRVSGATAVGTRTRPGRSGRRGPGRHLRQQAWQWAMANRAPDGSIPSGREIANQFGHQERWGKLVKLAGAAGDFGSEFAQVRAGA